MSLVEAVFEFCRGNIEKKKQILEKYLHNTNAIARSELVFFKEAAKEEPSLVDYVNSRITPPLAKQMLKTDVSELPKQWILTAYQMVKDTPVEIHPKTLRLIIKEKGLEVCEAFITSMARAYISDTIKYLYFLLQKEDRENLKKLLKKYRFFFPDCPALKNFFRSLTQEQRKLILRMIIEENLLSKFEFALTEDMFTEYFESHNPPVDSIHTWLLLLINNYPTDKLKETLKEILPQVSTGISNIAVELMFRKKQIKRLISILKDTPKRKFFIWAIIQNPYTLQAPKVLRKIIKWMEESDKEDLTVINPMPIGLHTINYLKPKELFTLIRYFNVLPFSLNKETATAIKRKIATYLLAYPEMAEKIKKAIIE